MIQISDGKPRKMKLHEITQCGVLSCHPRYGTRAVHIPAKRSSHGSPGTLSVCWQTRILLCAPLCACERNRMCKRPEWTGRSLGLGGGYSSVWQPDQLRQMVIQNTTAISRSQLTMEKASTVVTPLWSPGEDTQRPDKVGRADPKAACGPTALPLQPRSCLIFVYT